MTNGSSDRLDRIERILEGLAQNQGQVVETQRQIVDNQRQVIQSQERIVQIQGQIVQSQEQQQKQIQALVNAATHHEATIARLDAILERLIYREGRGNGDQPPT